MEEKIVYRILIGVLVLLFGFGAISNLLQLPEITKNLGALGYPKYFSYILGSAQLLGIIFLLIPKSFKLKEWVFIGMIINLLSALISHIAVEGVTLMVFVILVFIGLVLLAFNRHLKISEKQKSIIERGN